MTSKIHLKHIFYFFAALGILLFFAFAFVQNSGEAFDWLVMENSSSLEFSDFFRHVGYSMRHGSLYQQGNDVCYPPLAYLFYYFIWRINPFEGEMTGWTDWPLVAEVPYNPLIFVMYSVMACIFLYFAIQYFYEKSKAESFVLISTILFSLTFFSAAIERGNLILVVIALLVLALVLKDSSNVISREAALICIAVAACLKLYPALFGLLYIREKRYKEALRLLIYGLALFFLPFLFFGGIDGLMLYVQTSLELTSMTHFRWASISGLISDLAYQSGGWDGLQAVQKTASLVSMLTMLLFIGLSMLTKENWRRYLFMAGIFSVCVASGHRYAIVFFLLPLLYLLKDHGECELRGNYSLAVPFFLLGQIISIPTIFLIVRPLSSVYVEKFYFVFVYLLLLWGIGSEIVSQIRQRKG